MSNVQKVLDDIKTVSNTLDQVEEELKAGQDINLTNLNLDVQNITNQITDLPSQEAEQVRMPLVHLMEKVDLLYEKIRARHAEISDKLKGLNSREQATKAYQKKPEE